MVHVIDAFRMAFQGFFLDFSKFKVSGYMNMNLVQFTYPIMVPYITILWSLLAIKVWSVHWMTISFGLYKDYVLVT